MQRTLLKSKIHRATVTDAALHYEGSISIDRELMEAADIVPHEQVDVLDVTNGARLTTYAIAGPRGSGEICINGAAAHLIGKGDLVIIASYARYDDAEVRNHEPRVILVDEHNRAQPSSRVVRAK
jgi:aspartate 1-decarboxylase